MKIGREFANTVGGADPGGSGYSDVLAASMWIRLGPGPGSPSQRNKRRRRKSIIENIKRTLNLLLFLSRKQIKL